MQKIEKENSIAIENERGITLIALVITIVVTMILAGIAVKSGFGNKGLVKEARDTQANIEQAQQEGLQQIEDLKKDEKTIKDGVLPSEDNTAPTINAMTISKITKDSITVNISVTEEESGIDTIIYTATNGTDTNYCKLDIFQAILVTHIHIHYTQRLILLLPFFLFLPTA